MAHVGRDWQIEFMRAHPRIFRGLGSVQGYPECGEGWCDLLDRACGRIEAALAGNGTFTVLQIKEKYGTLRFFVRIKQKFGVLRVDWDGEISNETRASILNAIDLAVARSSCTCEVCGTVARLYSNRSWLATRCAEHALGDPQTDRAGLREYPHPPSGLRRAGHVLRAL